MVNNHPMNQITPIRPVSTWTVPDLPVDSMQFSFLLLQILSSFYFTYAHAFLTARNAAKLALHDLSNQAGSFCIKLE
jgi:hypothetical protein